MRCIPALAAATLLVPAGAAAVECNVLTPADIKAVTRADVQPLPSGGSPEHSCPPFKEADGKFYPEVERHRGPDKYQLSLKALPPDIYTRTTPVPGLGDEAVLVTDGTGSSGGKVQQRISDAQLKQLAERALAAR